MLQLVAQSGCFGGAWSPSLVRRRASIGSVVMLLVVFMAACSAAVTPQHEAWIEMNRAILAGDLGRLANVLRSSPGADVNWKPQSSVGAPVLVLAASKGSPDMVKFLLEKGADPNIGSGRNSTALWSAAYRGRLEVVLLLLDGGGDVDARENISGSTPLIAAAEGGHVNVVRALLGRGANPLTTTVIGMTARKRALKHRDVQTAEVLAAAEVQWMKSRVSESIVQQDGTLTSR